MQVNYSAAWVECKALAEAVDFSDVAAKQVVSVFMIFVASLVKSNGSLPPVLWLVSPVGWLPRNLDQLYAQRLYSSMGLLYFLV